MANTPHGDLTSWVTVDLGRLRAPWIRAGHCDTASGGSSRSQGTSNSVDSSRSLRYGFRWIVPAETITVELNMNDSFVTTFLELLYYTYEDRRSLTLCRHCKRSLSLSLRSSSFTVTSYRPGAVKRYAPADGSSTRGGSTSVRGRVRSPHASLLCLCVKGGQQ